MPSMASMTEASKCLQAHEHVRLQLSSCGRPELSTPEGSTSFNKSHASSAKIYVASCEESWLIMKNHEVNSKTRRTLTLKFRECIQDSFKTIRRWCACLTGVISCYFMLFHVMLFHVISCYFLLFHTRWQLKARGIVLVPSTRQDRKPRPSKRTGEPTYKALPGLATCLLTKPTPVCHLIVIIVQVW